MWKFNCQATMRLWSLLWACSTVPCQRQQSKSHNKQRNHSKTRGDTQSDNPSRFILMETIVTPSRCRGAVQKGRQWTSLIDEELLWDKWLLWKLDSYLQESKAESAYCAMIVMTKRELGYTQRPIAAYEKSFGISQLEVGITTIWLCNIPLPFSVSLFLLLSSAKQCLC